MQINHRATREPSPAGSRFAITLLLNYALLIVYGTLFPMGNTT
jgi:hypothetical protein